VQVENLRWKALHGGDAPTPDDVRISKVVTANESAGDSEARVEVEEPEDDSE